MHSKDTLNDCGFLREVANKADYVAATNALNLVSQCGCGLLVSGTSGCGKTTLVNAIVKALNLHPFRIDLGFPGEIVKLNQKWLDYRGYNLFERDIVLDDIGSERTLNEYGVKYEPVAEFIIEWHYKHIPGTRLLASTNMDAKTFAETYNERTLSRLLELCYSFRFEGACKRKRPTWELSTPSTSNRKIVKK